MNLKERIQKLCKDSGVSMNKVESDLNFGKGYISKLGKSTPNANKIREIADYFGTSVDFLMTGNESTEVLYTCPDCGLSYSPIVMEDAKHHIEVHDAWKKAEEKFGRLYCNSTENERIKYENAGIRDDESRTEQERYNAVIEILRCYFSDSVCGEHFNLNHVNFEKYVAMMMNGQHNRKVIAGNLSQQVINKYGTLPGIEDGKRYYKIPKDKLTSRDKRDISKDIDSIMEKLSLKEYGPAAYKGEELSEESAILFKKELEIALERLKLINKEKYNPNKNKK